jgi:hypothetical protein
VPLLKYSNLLDGDNLGLLYIAENKYRHEDFMVWGGGGRV